MARSGRSLARQCAVQALYQWRMTGQSPSQIERNFIENKNLTGRYLEYFLLLIDAVPLNIVKIDELIASHLDRDPDKVDLTEQAILRLGTYELAYARDIPTKVVLDEAVVLAKMFCSENGYKYVNGVLDKVARDIRGGITDEPAE